ncbi:FAD-binding dehydrogenase [Agrococcus casei]|uniref:Fumarate/succinate/L-aspartate dehydrogenases n=1 Tax=Agrococcus casei LMG 22410 TaxID=1255656 RepID=A0A1R4G6R5_9MICO|nr:FAD-binding dehydrogenase [Agrococcus casei]SJM63783.1 Fumarate/succinate/L-aspartate dehydrogenases [Agrococcus casei LMG 22410]
MSQTTSTDVVIVGAGLAGLVTAAEAVARGRRVTLIDQEPSRSFGGQAFWSFGGLLMVDTPEQRRLGIRDSHEVAHDDWMRAAGFDRETDSWGRQWAEAYLGWAAGDMRGWLRERGVSFFPVVGHAERGAAIDGGFGNTLPRFHITWGTGPGLVAPFTRLLRAGVEEGLVTLKFRHRADALIREGDAVVGVRGAVLAEDLAERGEASNRDVTGEFEIRAESTVIATGGIGGALDRVTERWPSSLGEAPTDIVRGVPEHVDGRGIELARESGAAVVNEDRMWHYTEGIRNWSPVWKNHGIRILPGPSSLWVDQSGKRLPSALYPGSDTLGTLEHLRRTGSDHSWFVLTQSILEKEFTLSGSEQNPDLTEKDLGLLAKRVLPGAPRPVQAFLDHGEDFIVANSLDELLDRMQQLGEGLDAESVRAAIAERDAAVRDPQTQDQQVRAIHAAREFLGERLVRTAKPHELLDERHWPLIAVRLHTLTRKTLGGVQTDLRSQALDAAGNPVPGLFAVGEAAGFGGGGVHGYRSLEGTFLGGCLHTGHRAGAYV